MGSSSCGATRASARCMCTSVAPPCRVIHWLGPMSGQSDKGRAGTGCNPLRGIRTCVEYAAESRPKKQNQSHDGGKVVLYVSQDSTGRDPFCLGPEPPVQPAVFSGSDVSRVTTGSTPDTATIMRSTERSPKPGSHPARHSVLLSQSVSGSEVDDALPHGCIVTVPRSGLASPGRGLVENFRISPRIFSSRIQLYAPCNVGSIYWRQRTYGG